MVCDTPQQADTEPMFRSTYIQVGTQPWDLDDEAVIPWTVTLPRLRPKKFGKSLSVQPPFHLRNLQGMRNRIDVIDSFTWTKAAKKNHEYMYTNVVACPWPASILEFIQVRLFAIGLNNKAVFFLDPDEPEEERSFGDMPSMCEGTAPSASHSRMPGAPSAKISKHKHLAEQRGRLEAKMARSLALLAVRGLDRSTIAARSSTKVQQGGCLPAS